MAEKLAARKLQRGEDGRLHVVTYDVQTGQPISDMTGYTLYTPDTTPQDLKVTTADPQAPAATALDTNLQEPQAIAEQIVNAVREGGGETNITGMLDNAPRAAGNNYGYIDKPVVASIMGMLGGPIGLAGKTVNAMINHNNVQAANAARTVIGLEPVSTMTTVRNTLSGNDFANGLIANAKIGNETYAVGFEAVTPDGRTTLTPEEARKRSLTTGQAITEATPEEVDRDVQAVEALGNAQKGPIGKAKDVAKGVVTSVKDAVFGKDKAAPIKSNAVTQTQEVLGAKPSGFAAVSPTYTKGIERSTSVKNYDRSALNPSLNAALDALSQTVPGINVNSGHRTPEHNKAVGGATNSRHISGTAVDLDIRDLSDQQKTAALEAAITNGVKGVGLYPGGRTMHVDTRTNPTTWGFNPQATYNSLRTPDGKVDVEATVNAAPSWAQNSIRSLYGAGTSPVQPTHGPVPTSREVALSTPATTMESRPTIAEGVVGGVYGNLGRFGQAYMDQGRVTPAQSLRSEFGPKDQIGVDQIDTMAKAFAGELSPRVLDGIAKRDPAAMAELASMTSAVVNRGYSERYKGDLESVVRDPTQVNSMMSKNMGVTSDNYSKYGQSIREGIQDVIDGRIAPSVDTLTHWENTMQPPSWTKDSTYSERVGDHTYHSLMNEFSPSQGFKDNYSEKVNKSFMDSTPEFDASYGYSDKIGSFNAAGKTGVNTSISKSMSTRTKDDNINGTSFAESSARDRQRNSAPGSLEGSRYSGVGFASSGNSGISSRTGSGKEKDDRGVTKGTSSSGGLNKSISSSMSTRSKDDNVGSSNKSSSTSKNAEASRSSMSTKTKDDNVGSSSNKSGSSKSSSNSGSSKSGPSNAGSDKSSGSSNSGGKSGGGSSGKSGGNSTW